MPGMCALSAARPPTHCWGNPAPTLCLPPRCTAFRGVLASCIAICPRWLPAVMRTLPLPGITSFRIGHGFSQTNSKRWLSQAPSRFFTEIALARAIDPLRTRALQAFDEFFFIHAKDVYPRYEFAPMKHDE